MRNLVDFLSGTKVLEEVRSPINGKIEVIKSFAFGTYIKVGGLTQSGGVVCNIWETALKRVKPRMTRVRNVLILGLGGGNAAKLVRKYYRDELEITGVDIDSLMVELGKKFFELSKYNVKVIIKDAYDFVKMTKGKSLKSKYDLILVDLYIGDEFPKKFESQSFIKSIKTILAPNGLVVFNRLYYGEKRVKAAKFGERLEKIFKNVDIVFPQANIIFICNN